MGFRSMKMPEEKSRDSVIWLKKCFICWFNSEFIGEGQVDNDDREQLIVESL